MTSMALILAALAQPPQAPEWKPVKPADGSFFAEMPAGPKLASKEIPGEQGSFRRDTYTCLFEGASYSLQATRYSEPIPEGSRETILDQEGRSFLEARRGQVLREDQVAVQGRPGWDVTVRAPGDKGGVAVIRCRAVLADQTLYHLTVVSTGDKPLPDAAARFIRSFKFDPGPSVADETPEQALRTFLVALAARDGSTLEAVALPAEGLERLLGGARMKPAQLAAARRQAANQTIKALKAGDEYTLPDGKKQAVAAQDVAEDRAVLLPQGAPSPTHLRKVEGHWKVDAQPLVDARKAADAPKGKAKPKKGTR